MFDVTCYDKNGNLIEFFMQWDQNQYIYIPDYESDVTPIVHFFNCDSEYALAVGDESDVWLEDGTLVSKVPNQILQENKMIFIYVYEYEVDTQSGKSIHRAKIPVHSRKQPSDMVFEENIEGVDIVALNKKVKTLMSSVSTLNYETAELSTRMDMAETNIAANSENITANTAGISINTSAIETNETNIQKNTEDIAILNGEGDGSVAKQISDAFDTILGSLPEGSEGTVIEYMNNKISELQDSLEKTDSGIASRVETLESSSHTHTNKDLLDTYAQKEEDLAAAVAATHEHENKDVIDTITAAKVASWDAMSGDGDAIDATLSVSGKAADAAVVGENITTLQSSDSNLQDQITELSSKFPNLISYNNSITLDESTFSSDAWNTLTSDSHSVSLDSGVYIVKLFVSLQAYSDEGIATVRLNSDSTEVLNNRATTPIHKGLLTSVTITGILQVGSTTTYNFLPQGYGSVDFLIKAANISIVKII